MHCMASFQSGPHTFDGSGLSARCGGSNGDPNVSAWWFVMGGRGLSFCVSAGGFAGAARSTLSH